ncbi:MAG: hypothetical protein B7Z15_14385 [Rhizobiales bacterium 32-66-8]|nr:MAG: hypothetical protein B7Z15_14385 [Rhizobiales bacterium 32-66-8]
MSPASLFIALRNWRQRPDDAVLHLVFASLIALSLTLLVQDYQALAERADGAGSPADWGVPSETPATPLSPSRPDSQPEPPAPDPALEKGMVFELMGDGRLMATGSITPGTAATFADEVEKRGSYIRTVVLRSPGGSVQDALAMGRLIRARGFATEVAAGAYCASSCPLVFAGGTERRAGRKAAIGVHQVFSPERAPKPGVRAAPGPDRMDSAQRVSAECQRYLRDMGVDPEVWIHAMETPKEKLFYFTADSLIRLKLATTLS